MSTLKSTITTSNFNYISFSTPTFSIYFTRLPKWLQSPLSCLPSQWLCLQLLPPPSRRGRATQSLTSRSTPLLPPTQPNAGETPLWFTSEPLISTPQRMQAPAIRSTTPLSELMTSIIQTATVGFTVPFPLLVPSVIGVTNCN